MVALGFYRGNGSALGAFCLNATSGLGRSTGEYWQSRASLQLV